MSSTQYRSLSYEEKDNRFDEYYDVLIGPDGFECMLGEPEDRTWGRDGKQAVERLNAQHAEIKRLQAIVDQMAEIYPLAADPNFPLAAMRLCQRAAEKARKQ